MTRIKATKRNKGLELVLLISGSLLVLVAIIMLIGDIIPDSKTDLKPINYILLFIQGALLIGLASFNNIYRKYYIEWDNERLEYYLPKDKNPVIIEISDIHKVEIKLFEIYLGVGKETMILNLEHVDFEEIKSIKRKFEEIKKK